jgi:hypothetical protein
MESSGAGMKKWYPGEFAPQLYYINEELRGMAAALVRKQGDSQKWEAFDMRKRNASDTGPLLLGEHDTVELARQQIEALII